MNTAVPNLLESQFRKPPAWSCHPRPGGREYRGAFVCFEAHGTRRVTITGRVVEWDGLAADVYLHNPPSLLRQHPHGRCLQLVDPRSGWFKMHWQKPARTFDQARAYVEGMMNESKLFEKEAPM